MPNETETGSPLTLVIQQTKEQTLAGLGDWELKKPLELEFSTIIKGKAESGLDIRVITFGAKVEAEEVQKIKMYVGPKDEAEVEEKNARIEKAKTDAEMEKRRRAPAYFSPTTKGGQRL